MKKLVLLLVAVILVLSPIAAQALSIGCWNNWPTVGMQFNDKLSGYLGYNYYGNFNNIATSWYLVKLDYNLVKLGDIQTKVGVDYWGSTPYYNSALELTYGASFMPLNNLSIGFDVMLVAFNNDINTSTTNVLPRANAAINLFF